MQIGDQFTLDGNALVYTVCSIGENRFGLSWEDSKGRQVRYDKVYSERDMEIWTERRNLRWISKKINMEHINECQDI